MYNSSGRGASPDQLQQTSPGSQQSSPGSQVAPGMSPVKSQKTCLVCGDRALSCNFGAVTCESCKAFFRRHASKEIWGQCDGQCPVTIETRSYCRRCRLMKCYNVGMRKELILTDEQKERRRQKILENRKKRISSEGSSNSGMPNSGGVYSATSDTSPPSLASQPVDTAGNHRFMHSAGGYDGMDAGGRKLTSAGGHFSPTFPGLSQSAPGSNGPLLTAGGVSAHDTGYGQAGSRNSSTSSMGGEDMTASGSGVSPSPTAVGLRLGIGVGGGGAGGMMKSEGPLPSFDSVCRASMGATSVFDRIYSPTLSGYGSPLEGSNISVGAFGSKSSLSAAAAGLKDMPILDTLFNSTTGLDLRSAADLVATSAIDNAHPLIQTDPQAYFLHLAQQKHGGLPGFSAVVTSGEPAKRPRTDPPQQSGDVGMDTGPSDGQSLTVSSSEVKPILPPGAPLSSSSSASSSSGMLPSGGEPMSTSNSPTDHVVAYGDSPGNNGLGESKPGAGFPGTNLPQIKEEPGQNGPGNDKISKATSAYHSNGAATPDGEVHGGPASPNDTDPYRPNPPPPVVGGGGGHHAEGSSKHRKSHSRKKSGDMSFYGLHPPDFCDDFLSGFSEGTRTVLQLVSGAYREFCRPTHRSSANPRPEGVGSLLNSGEECYRSLVIFAKQFPQFRLLPQEDQIAVLKSNVVEVMILRFCKCYNKENNSWNICKNGKEISFDANFEEGGFRGFCMQEYANFIMSALRSSHSDDLVLILMLVQALFWPGETSAPQVRDAYMVYQDAMREYLDKIYPNDPEMFNNIMSIMTTLRMVGKRAHDMMYQSSVQDLHPLLQEIFDLK